MKQELHQLAKIEELWPLAAELILAAGRRAVAKRGRFTLVLTGGGTVRGLYRYLAASPSGSELKSIFGKTDFFLGDERWVQADHEDSNGAMVRRLLLAPLAIDDNRIFLIPTRLASPEANALEYEKTLRLYFAGELSGENDLPKFDLILLGMGGDGHVASLFPGTEALQEKTRWVTTSFPPALPPVVARITITMPLLNRSREVVIMAAGREKQAIVRAIMAEPKRAAERFPAGLLTSLGRKIWLFADS